MKAWDKVAALDGAWNLSPEVVGPRDVTVDPYNPAVVKPRHSIAAPQTETEEAGEGRIIATGIDDEARLYRDNKPKRLWPRNAVSLNYQVLLLNGPDVPELQPDGGVVEKNWENNNPKSLVRSLPTTGLKARLTFDTRSTQDKPELIWRNLYAEAAKWQGRQGKTNWHPTFVHTMSHGGSDHLTISQVPGGTDYGATWVTPLLPKPNDGKPRNDFWLEEGPRLAGVSCFISMGCSSSHLAQGNGVRRAASDTDSHSVPYYTPNMQNPPHYIATPEGTTNSGAENSIGWKFGVIYNYNLGRNPAQAWYNCFYRYGTAPPNNSTAFSSLEAAEMGYDGVITAWGRKDGHNYFTGKENCDSLHHWVVTYRDKPIMDNQY